ncbi:hypothetical protein PEDI_19650 [Persicobacter diffluens]|uniref:Uncharacterized protein n=1 Tax=Persicobacter diffluens TaxID=981 RepID=A0AAN4VYR5_9BACT|nr:hypothetical protein PEDI_19650 [Persicobacter diffluens]
MSNEVYLIMKVKSLRIKIVVSHSVILFLMLISLIVVRIWPQYFPIIVEGYFDSLIFDLLIMMVGFPLFVFIFNHWIFRLKLLWPSLLYLSIVYGGLNLVLPSILNDDVGLFSFHDRNLIYLYCPLVMVAYVFAYFISTNFLCGDSKWVEQ